MKVEFEIIGFEKPETSNVIIGQAHFIKTVEDIYEVLVGSVPSIQFGLAFCESSGKCLVRQAGTNEALVAIAGNNALRIGCGHMFIVVLQDTYPINVLNQIKNVPEVCRIFCATANALQVIVAATEQGRSFIGVVDGSAPRGIETKQDVQERKQLLRKFGYKL